ncbi:SRPBCC family protein [Lacisediminihabitans changchengi]|uniref:SRPBCC domain-containing protein n=1 Tax=Lacisediminihabitans changchengi TaxID=2787634 RepID=A0A934SID2_9MICO|nr:SRPBCC domain-containing protein [Lacisediminihabitans changchengi]MBK4347212.1 SRPBCC domain-containing protein [Lacisediminihabitans changchengi]
MPFLSSVKNLDDLTMTITAQFDADVNRVWQLWEDPRQLERWWGPPTWPATFVTHDFSVGGRSSYYMTGPEGDKAGGWWQITAIDAPTSLRFDDGFADADGEPDTSIAPTHAVLTLEAKDGGTRMSILTQFDSVEQLEQMVAMGMEEGMSLAIGQIDGILAE